MYSLLESVLLLTNYIEYAFSVFFVCTLHEKCAPAVSNRKNSKLQIILVKQ